MSERSPIKFNAYPDDIDRLGQFSQLRAEDEVLHPIALDAGYELTETQYFGFNIPEADIDAEIYVWFHPALRMVSGGILCWRGLKRWELSAECHDYRHFMPLPARLDDYTLPNGLRVKTIEPLKEFELSYEDKSRNTELWFRTCAIMPPAGRSNGGHFTQAMRTEGWLTLRGEHYEIKGFFTRDRSWGEQRSEAPKPVPPVSWIAGVFNEDKAFHIIGFDDPEAHPEWVDTYSMLSGGRNFLWGYWRENGRTIAVRSASKRTRCAADGITPESLEIDLVTFDGANHRLKGIVTARCPWMPWSNALAFFGLTRWECEDMTGWGDIQDIIFGDHSSRFAK